MKTKFVSPYPRCHKVQIALSEFFQSLDKGRMWCYNILRDNEGIISHLLQLDPINAGSILLTSNLFAPKRENYEPILTVKIIEWRKLIDYFGLIIEADPSRVGKKKIYTFHIGYVPGPSSIKLHISRHHMDKKIDL